MPGQGLGQADAVTGGLTDVGVVQEPVDGRGSEGLGHQLVKGCRVQVRTEMLFEQIPAYLEFFGFPSTTPEELRRLARISY